MYRLHTAQWSLPPLVSSLNIDNLFPPGLCWANLNFPRCYQGGGEGSPGPVPGPAGGPGGPQAAGDPPGGEPHPAATLDAAPTPGPAQIPATQHAGQAGHHAQETGKGKVQFHWYYLPVAQPSRFPDPTNKKIFILFKNLPGINIIFLIREVPVQTKLNRYGCKISFKLLNLIPYKLNNFVSLYTLS